MNQDEILKIGMNKLKFKFLLGELNEAISNLQTEIKNTKETGELDKEQYSNKLAKTECMIFLLLQKLEPRDYEKIYVSHLNNTIKEAFKPKLSDALKEKLKILRHITCGD